jgi:hypothetical protein
MSGCESKDKARRKGRKNFEHRGALELAADQHRSIGNDRVDLRLPWTWLYSRIFAQQR